MNFSQIKNILLRVFNSYVKKHLNKLILSLILSLVVAGSTGAIARLLDPAIKNIFIDVNYLSLKVYVNKLNVKHVNLVLVIPPSMK